MKIYLAGPGVFRRDAKDWGARLAAACAEHGLYGLYPLDADVPLESFEKAQQRQMIFTYNCQLIRQADMIFADLRAFRSTSEPDSGTAFEVGFAHALGKPVWLWLPDCLENTTMLNRVNCARQGDMWLDAAGQIVEDFNAPLNLMLWDAASGVSFNSEPEAAIAKMAAWLSTNSLLVSRET